MNKALNALEEFGEECTIHGVRETLSRKYSSVSKLLWVFMFILAVGFMLIVISNTLKEYLGKPTATIIKIGLMHEFPTVTLCPTVWMNDSAAKAAGYTRDMHTYVDSVHFLSPNRYFWMASSNATEGYGEIVDWTKVILAIKELLESRNQTLSKMLGQISYSSDELLGVVATDLSTNFSFTESETTAGMCYRVWDHRSFTRFRIPTAMLVIEVTHQVSQLTFSNNPQDVAALLFVGDSGIGEMPLGGYGLIASTNYDIKVSAQKVSRFATSNGGSCAEEATLRSRNTCMGKCLRDKCHNAKSCEIYFPGSTSSISQFCTYVKPKDHCIYLASVGIEICDSLCSQPCTTVITSLMLYPNPMSTKTNTSRLVFTLENPTTSIEISERGIYTAPMLLSNLGGVASLFVGCSVMSLVHAICFWAMKIPKLWRGDVDVGMTPK